MNCFDAVRVVPSRPVQCRVILPVTSSLMEDPLRLNVIWSDTSAVEPAWVTVPDACVLMPSE
ncbi:hypothetical protein [Bifidobacterium dentium]|uniref:hypothetical protein n=1 Tax=Bifidobacterium dentium TaxID=1689 RepID=UPI001ADAFDFE|nr:hypothetical protein [Bifidobacterium dentium]MCK6131871.1 hypothetical protein [Bifidobacterium dentium]QTL76896.1 hypothetical protein J7M35_05140 [Bifidobacterium dentium]